MTKFWHVTTLSVALLAAFPLAAGAQSLDDLRKEQKVLKDRVNALEQKLKDAESKPAEGGMTPQEKQDFNRISIKTEALEDNQEAMGFRGLKIGGYFDPSFIYNRNQHRSGFQFLNRVSDDGYNYDNSYFGLVSLDIQKEMEGGTKWRLTLMPNRGAGSIADSSGNSIVHEASVSIPIGDLQTRFLAGQIPDWSGYEYIQPTQTKLVTRGLLLDFTEPTAYTGAGMEVLSGKWDVKAVIANYNATKRAANEKTPVLAYRVDYGKDEFNGFGFAGVHGKAANFSPLAVDPVTGVTQDSRIDLFEVDAYFIRGDLTWQGQIGVGRQKNASITADPVSGDLRDAQWWGLSTLVAYKFVPRWEAVARVDYINNKKNGGGLLQYSVADGRNGIGPDPVGDPDVGANRYAIAVGVNFLLTQNATLKTEYRLDRASLPVFLDTKDGSYKKSNSLLGAAVVVSF